MMRRTHLAILLTALLCCLASCERDGLELDLSVGPFSGETRKVMLLYEAGFNSLTSDISSNISTLRSGYLPGKGRSEDVLLVFSHTAIRRGSYSQETEPVLFRMYETSAGPVMDTLKTWPEGTAAANAAMMKEVFDLVKELFPAKGYGAVLSSHATGWLPKGYFSDPKPYEGNDRNTGGGVWAAPRLRTFGQEYYDAGTQTEEIELHDLADAIPYHLDYLLFDACLMASAEVAWALKDVCSQIGFSPCEIPAAGFNYATLTEHLLQPEVPDLVGACRDYYSRYENDTVYGATISVVDCTRLDPLAEVCRTLFDRYRTEIRALDGSAVQVYDRQAGGKHYYAFFDLKDLLREAGASESDLSDLQSALDQALLYEAHTARFIDVKLDRVCGLSVYLPAYSDYRADRWHGTRFLDGFYKENVAWNQATGLVE